MRTILLVLLFSGAAYSQVLEFRKGDTMPFQVRVLGDWVESADSSVPLVVKRPFWLNIGEKDVLMSLDGKEFHPVKRFVQGTFTLAVGTGLQATLEARAKE